MITATSKKIALFAIRLKSPINPTPTVIKRSIATTRSTIVGPFKNRKKININDKQIMGITMYIRYCSTVIVK